MRRVPGTRRIAPRNRASWLPRSQSSTRTDACLVPAVESGSDAVAAPTQVAHSTAAMKMTQNAHCPCQNRAKGR